MRVPFIRSLFGGIIIPNIHQNPHRANLVDALHYQWSSHQEYLGNPELVAILFPLSLFDTPKQKAIKGYLTFRGEMETRLLESMNKQEDEIEKGKHIKESPQIASDTLMQILKEVTKIEIESIKGNSKNKRSSDIRKLYIHMLKEYTDLSSKEIADLLGIGTSAVSNVLSGRYKENDFLINSSIEIEKYVNL